MNFRNFMGNRRVRVKAVREVAFESQDHLNPRGTANDNSVNPLFNKKLGRLIDRKYSLLDLGCAGGGFVRACLDDNNFATGLEGSDFSKKNKRAEWSNIPDHLFTADVTQHVLIEFSDNGSDYFPMKYDVVTSWEFMEHIHQDDIPRVIDNVVRHLAPNGIWIMSISSIDDICNGVNYHQTVKPKAWWIEFFANHGLLNREDIAWYFNNDWVRGMLQGADSFHLTLQRNNESGPALPPSFQFQGVDLLQALNFFFDQAVKRTPTSNGNFEYCLLIARELESRGFSGNIDILFIKAFSLASIGRLREALLEVQEILNFDPHHERAGLLKTEIKDLLNKML